MSNLDNFPCSGKNMNYFLGPWILLVIYKKGAIHGFQIKKILEEWLDGLSISFNMTGLYRHLNAFEKRGIVKSKWEFSGKGPARKIYFLTDMGKECLSRWIRTLIFQKKIINSFIEKAESLSGDSKI